MIYVVGPTSIGSQFTRVELHQVLQYFENKKELQLDTETYGRDPHTKKLVTVQVGDRQNQFVIDVRHVPVKKLEPLLTSKLCLSHNAKFEYKFLKTAGIVIENFYDTMLAEAVIFNGYNDWGYSLQDCVKRYLNITLEKETRGDFHKIRDKPLSDRQILYAANDVKHLQDVRDKQKKYIDKYDLHYAIHLENQALKALGDIELNGMYLDKDAWLDIAKANEKEALQKEIELDEFLIDMDIGYRPTGEQDLFGAKQRKLKLNYGSPPQTLDMLRRSGLPVNSTSAFELEPFRDQEIVQKLFAVRRTAKKVSTYGKSFLKSLNPVTGRIHTEFWQIKDTFRLGSGNKKHNLPNIQNIPRENRYRNCFKARSGYKWVSLDYSQQEMRIMADYSYERSLINAVNEGKDLHCFVGSMMFGKEIKKNDPERDEVKAINFGKPYGMGHIKLAGKLQITEDQALEKLKMHESAFPFLDRWLKEQAKFGVTNGYILINSIHKGRRWFPNIKLARELRHQTHNANWKEIYRIEGGIERASMNTPIQGTGAIIMKEALIAAREILKKYDAYLICTVHDQLDIEVRDDQAQAVLEEVSQAMERVGNKYVSHVTMPVDGGITTMWNK